MLSRCVALSVSLTRKASLLHVLQHLLWWDSLTPVDQNSLSNIDRLVSVGEDIKLAEVHSWAVSETTTSLTRIRKLIRDCLQQDAVQDAAQQDGNGTLPTTERVAARDDAKEEDKTQRIGVK